MSSYFGTVLEVTPVFKLKCSRYSVSKFRHTGSVPAAFAAGCRLTDGVEGDQRRAARVGLDPRLARGVERQEGLAAPVKPPRAPGSQPSGVIESGAS